MFKGINERDDNGGFTVMVDGQILNPEASQKLINHSPDGFGWGYGGSGPAQLALAIMLLFLDKKEALRFYQQFKWEIIAKLPREGFELTKTEIQNWINNQKLRDVDGG